MQKVLAIVGPTAVGKTSLSLKLAHLFNGSIISGDSMQIYRHLDIGTAKIMKNQMQGIKHYLINIKDIDERYSAAEFVSDTQKSIYQINRGGKLPIIVGGTGFYLQALLDNFDLGGDHYPSNNQRHKLKKYADLNGKASLWNRLKNIDPKAAMKIPINNERRVIRALEVYENTGNLFSEQGTNPKVFDSFLIGLNTDRQLLYQRINHRVDIMLQHGLINEARWLYQNGGLHLPAGKGIGYRELDDFFAQKKSLQKSVELIKRDSRHYAKRQLTWFRNKMEVHWYDLIQNKKEINKIKSDVNEWLTK